MTTYTDRRSNSASSSSDVGLAYYGFARGASHQSRADDDRDAPDTPTLPLRHEVNKGWKAIHGLAASHKSNNSTAKFIEATTTLRRKRGNTPNDSDTSDPDLQVTKRRAKRPRSSESSPNATAFTGIGLGPMGDGVGTKKKVVKVSWTEEEVEMLFKGREDGKDWDTIHSVSFSPFLLDIGPDFLFMHMFGLLTRILLQVLPRHTRCACQKKYRDVSKQKEKREISVLAQEENQIISSPSSGFQGDAEDDVVDEQEVQE